MTHRVEYEWTVEEIDEFGDIVDTHFLDTLAEAIDLRDDLRAGGYKLDVGLVRHVGDEDDGEVIRHYAYLNDAGELPEVFSSCSDEGDGPAVPKRFFAEVAKAA